MVNNQRKIKFKNSESLKSYKNFEKINGSHELQDKLPECYVPYKVRTRHGGRVSIFNFNLAKEMGLISKDHPDEMNERLEEKLLDTFSLMIINEWDIENNILFPENEIKENYYMATRYLQLQHDCKLGTTSGDGRSIWNGSFQAKGKVWDISSCGTGATKLSPASSKNNIFYQSGDPSVSYGCGFSEIDEGLESLFFSEVLHKNNIKTERVLLVIEYEKGFCITVRAHENLLRPSHFFRLLKLQQFDSLMKLTDYYIERQSRSGVWENVPKQKVKKLNYFLEKIIINFSKTVAQFEDEYIFCWLDWDGDNILMDGGIIDYGSVRQFGLYHDEYRYDDVDRFSTSIKEQKKKAKYMVQVFIQLVDFLKSENKKPLSDFSKSKYLDIFEESYKKYKMRNLMYKVGLNTNQIDLLVKNDSQDILSFLSIFSYFERCKAKSGIHNVADGINWNAVFCMRDILRELPQFLLSNDCDFLNDQDFIDVLKSNYAKKEDLVLSRYRKSMISKFQTKYMHLIKLVAKAQNKSINSILLEVSMRSSVINKYDRVTGDSITTIVDKVMKKRPKYSPNDMYELLSSFVNYQNLDPEKKISKKQSLEKSPMLKEMLRIVRDYREGL